MSRCDPITVTAHAQSREVVDDPIAV